MTNIPALLSLKKIAVAAVCLLISIASFSQNGTDSTRHIVNVWKYRAESVEPAAKVLLERLKKSNPAAAAEYTFEKVLPMVAAITFDYKADSTSAVVTPLRSSTGKWSLSADKKIFKTVSDRDGTVVIHTIMQISEKLFCIKTEDGVLLTMIPANQ